MSQGSETCGDHQNAIGEEINVGNECLKEDVRKCWVEVHNLRVVIVS